jgi:AcrR family transcriptional regulator
MTRTTRHDWLENGLHLLSQSGIDNLTIDSICAHLKVTKGSFYHHFTNREDFLSAILDYWEATFTQRFIALSQEGTTPAEQMQRLTQLVVESHGTDEVAIRTWAQVDPVARAVQKRVDQQRITYLEQLQAHFTADPHHAHLMAKMIYAILIGAQTVLPPYTRDELNQVYHLLSTLVMQSQRS